ncbi:MAG: hypothetical protein DRJ64_05300, partial [Thermoprotei archaeon]
MALRTLLKGDITAEDAVVDLISFVGIIIGIGLVSLLATVTFMSFNIPTLIALVVGAIIGGEIGKAILLEKTGKKYEFDPKHVLAFAARGALLYFLVLVLVKGSKFIAFIATSQAAIADLFAVVVGGTLTIPGLVTLAALYIALVNPLAELFIDP